MAEEDGLTSIGKTKHNGPVIEVTPDYNTFTGVAGPSGSNDHEGDFVTENEDRDLNRGLEQRHISLIAIAGAIGTGLFLGLGSSIQTAGPLGALLGYATVGLIVCAVQFALGEVTAFLPVTGSFVRHAEFLVDPAMGFAIGWNIVYGNWLSIPAEISAICVLFQYWTDVNSSVWILLVIAMTFCVGIAFVRVYGEVGIYEVEKCDSIANRCVVGRVLVCSTQDHLHYLPHHPGSGHQPWRNPRSTSPWVSLLEDTRPFRGVYRHRILGQILGILGLYELRGLQLCWNRVRCHCWKGEECQILIYLQIRSHGCRRDEKPTPSDSESLQEGLLSRYVNDPLS